MSDGMISSDLIHSIEIRCAVPVAQSTFTADDFLQFATEELQLRMTTLVRSMHEDYFLFTHEVPLEANVFRYTIPSRASGNMLRDVQYKTGPNNYNEMTRIGVGDRMSGNNWSGVNTPLSNLQRFYVENNKVVLMTNNTPNSIGTELCFIFYIRPSKMVQDSKVGIINSINRTTGEIVLDSIPTAYTTALKYDFYKGSSPYSILKIDFNLIALNPSTRTVTVDPNNIPEELEIGDHLPIAGQAIIPQIPNELHSMLAQMVACRLMEAQGDQEGLAAGNVKLSEMKESLGMLIDNRVEDAPQKLVSRFSLTRLSSFGKYW
jgi:hypothetical protein